MHTLCLAKSWIPTVFCALKVLSHDLTLCMCTTCATTVVGRSLYHYPYVWDTNLPTTVSLPQSMKTGTSRKGWNSRKFPKFRAVVGSKISAYWTFLTILHLSTTQNTDTHVQSEVLQVSEILRFGWCHCPRVPRWVGEGPLPFERFGKVTKPIRLESTGFYSADFFNSKTCAAK